MLKSKSSQQEQGFTLVEVLVAILITTVFVAIAMQAIVLATIFKVRGQQSAEATTWIQEDSENVKRQASTLQYTSLTAAAISTTNVLQVASVDGFQPGDTLVVGTDSTNKTVAAAGVNSTSKTITLTSTLRTNWEIGTVVVATTKCNRPTGTLNAGFAKYLEDNLQTKSNRGVRNSKGVLFPYALMRSSYVKEVEPYEVLQLTYGVTSQNAYTTLTSAASATSNTISVVSSNGFKAGDKLMVGTDSNNIIQSISTNTITLTSQLGSNQLSGIEVGTPIATLNIEIIPNAAFQCP